MPRASRIPIKKDLSENLKDYFNFLIYSLRSPKEIDQFFADFLTDEEKKMLTKRLMLHLMLENGYKAWEIQTILSVSRETIRVHNGIWKSGGDSYRKMMKKLAGREKEAKFLEKIEKILRPIEIIATSKTNPKSRAKLAGGHLFDD